jgi:hypothetical protein
MLLESGSKDEMKLPVQPPVTTARVAGSGPFSAGDMFRENAQVPKITHLSEGFRNLFFKRRVYSSRDGVLGFYPVSAGSEQTLRPSLVPAEFECSLVDVWSFLCAQPQGEAGPLLTTGVGTVFYEVLNPNETDSKKVRLAAVVVSWRKEFQGWHIYADEVGKPMYGLSEGMQVAFRTPLV